MSETKLTAAETTLAVIGWFLLVPLLAMECGWALSTLWGWFAVPLGAPAIGVWHGTGLALLTRIPALKVGEENKKRTPSEWFWLAIAYALVLLICVGMGWLYRYAMLHF